MIDEKSEALNAAKRRVNMPYLLGYVGTLLLGSIHFGFNISFYGSCFNYFAKMYQWESEDDKQTWLAVPNTLVPVGALVTSLISGSLASRGRRYVLFLGAIFAVFGVIFMSAIQMPRTDHKGSSVAFLCFGRLLMGLSVGLYSSMTPSYINEVTPDHLTGAFGSGHQLCITFAIIITYVIGLALPTGTAEELRSNLAWRVTMAIPGMIVLAQTLLLLFVFTDDSPAIYASQGRFKAAEAALRKIYADEAGVAAKLKDLKEAAQQSAQSSGDSGSYYNTYKMAFWIGLILPAIQQLTGINIIIFYAPKVFEQQGEAMAKVLSLIMSVLNFLFTFGSVFLSDKLGRRLLLIAGCFGCGAGLLLCMIFANKDNGPVGNWIFNISVYFFLAAFEMSHGPICWVYMSEILPTQWMGYGTASSWLFTIFVSLTTPYFFNYLGRWTYFIYLVCMGLSAVYCFAYIKETKGKSKKEIMESFASAQDVSQGALLHQA